MKIVKYKDKKGEFRARIVAKNNRIVFETSEGYKRRRGVDTAVISLTKAVANAQYTIVDETDK